MIVIRVIFQFVIIPFALLYGLIMDIRNLFYGLNLFRSLKFATPVLSIGNISVGGTGKTPFTIHLANHFIHTNKIAIVSRGYGRTTKGVQLVSNGDKVLLSADEAGDEPYLFAHRVPGAIVMVSEKRTAAIRILEEKIHPDLILLDDAFQHRSVRRDADIVLLNRKEAGEWPLPLPSGRLREFMHNLRRADIIIHTNSDFSEPPKHLNNPKIKQYRCRSYIEKLVDLQFEEVGKISDLAGDLVFAFCGIAHPQRFFLFLNDHQLNIRARKTFGDHHRYTYRDWDEILETAKKNGCTNILCTEKDLVKIKEFAIDKNVGCRVLAVRLDLEIENEQLMLDDIIKLIDIFH